MKPLSVALQEHTDGSGLVTECVRYENEEGSWYVVSTTEGYPQAGGRLVAATRVERRNVAASFFSQQCPEVTFVEVMRAMDLCEAVS